MRKSLLLIVGLLATAAVCPAQNLLITNTGWFTMAGLSTLAITNDSTTDGNTNPAPVKMDEGVAPIFAETITPGIQALAGDLGNDPVRIFNYVHDHIRHVLYFGSKKGAELTLLEKSGNDFDQDALLVALLRAAGYSAAYQFGWMLMPYDNPDGSDRDIHHWLGLSLTNSNWSVTSGFLDSLFKGVRNYPTYTANTNYPINQYQSDGNTVALQRLWVTVTVGGTNYNLDPAFKVTEPITGVNLASAMDFSSNGLLSAAGGFTFAGGEGAYSIGVSNVNETSVRTTLAGYAANLLNYIHTNCPNASVEQVLGGQFIVPSTNTSLSQTLLFPTTNLNGHMPIISWSNEPTNLMSTLDVSLLGSDYQWFMPQLEGGRLSLTTSSNGAVNLWLEDTSVASGSTGGGSGTFDVTLTGTHPHGGWDTFSNVFIPGTVGQSGTKPYANANASYVLTYAFEPDWGWLQERQRQLDIYLQQGFSDTSRQVVTETLNVMALNWQLQVEYMSRMLAQQIGVLPMFYHRLGRMSQESGYGYYIDVYLGLDGSFSSSNQNDNHSFQWLNLIGYFGSAMEHGVIEQLQTSNLTGASSVKILELANTNGQPVYIMDSLNWPFILTNLVGYSTTSLNEITQLVSQGYTLFLPQNGLNEIDGPGSWSGYGMVAESASGVQMLIGDSNGTHYGGYDSSFNATVDPAFTDLSGYTQPTYFGTPSAATAADPVNMVDGTFQVQTADLSLGGMEPSGLKLSRYYSSGRRNSNLAGVAPGWLHNYYANAATISAPQAALGGTTPAQAASLLVATCAANGLYYGKPYIGGTPEPPPCNWLVTALIAKWGIDQITAHAVSVSLGNQTLQFIEQADGSYTPPANCNMTLAQSGGDYAMQERRGRTFNFNSSNSLSTIVDPYGNQMTFSHNSSNWVSQVTDSRSRHLTFTYSGQNLTGVADSTGRSVSYGYTGQDLTSFTDAEGKTSTYTYDTNHEIIETFDASEHLVVTNNYDGFGRITTQYTLGATNRLWQVASSGWETSVIDPMGGEQEYFYDDKSRQIGFEDALGNLTQASYDGQNHVSNSISPLGETNLFIYDGNNNLIETIDPLGSSNVFTYDVNNNLIAATDGRGKTSHFGYNSEFSLDAQTNGNGDWVVFSFNSNGTLGSRQDAGGTTGYGYDSDGTLNSITYPGSLGSESFINNALGDPTSHTDVRGFITTLAYNNRRQLTNTIAPTNVITSAFFDANGNLSGAKDGRGNFTSNSWSTTRKLLSTTMPPTAQGAPVVTSTYDNRDWLSGTQNPLGYTTYFTNDAAQRLIATTDPLQRTTALAYDNDSHQTTSADAAGDLTTQFWNARGNLIKVIDAASNIVGKAYDGAGNLIYLTNRNGKLWTFQYDGANRLTNTVSPLSHSSSQVYNNRGLLQSSTDPLNRTTTFGYDARGRMTSKTDNVGVNNYVYDGNNNLTQLTNAGGPALSWVYDAYNRPVSFTNAAGYVIQYRYDANGNVTNLIYPGDLTVTYYYDSNNRLTNVSDWSGRETVITYDLAGHITSVTRPNNTVRLTSYDNAGELTNIVEETTAKFPICFYTLNYNLAGRVQWEFKGPLPHTNTLATRAMTYDNDNRLETFNSTSVSVDNDGNLTYGPGTNGTFGTYTYNPRNELTSAGGLEYGYDPTGNRTSLTNDSAISTFVVNPQGSRVLMRITGGVTNYYIYGGGLLYEIDETATTTTTAFYHFDSRGSTVVLTDGNGNPTDGIEYSPYGTTTYRFGTNNTPFLYNGRYGVQTDPNGLLYMRARYYNPYISRFINADPSGFSGGLNFYAFCNDNPISLTDPFGLGAQGDNSGYSLFGQMSQFSPSLAPSGPYPYYTGSGLASDLGAGVANFSALVGNSVNQIGDAAFSTLGALGQFQNNVLDYFGMDSAGLAASIPILSTEESILAGAGDLAAEGASTPLGFASADQFSQSVQELNAALAKSGITDASIGVRGSSVTGVSFGTGQPFSAASDIDFFVESGQLTQGLRTSQNIPGFVNPNLINSTYDPIAEWSQIWSENLGRNVSVGGFQPGTVPAGPVIRP